VDETKPPAQPVAVVTPTQEVQQPPMQGYMRVERKKPWLAALLGILVVGFGHFYLGKWLKGIALIIIAIIASVATGFLAAPIFWVISCVWAYYDAKAYNRQAGYPE
jgi:TM2 domain-containing membrane protein YozV